MKIVLGQNGPLQAYSVEYGEVVGLDWTAVTAVLSVIGTHQTIATAAPQILVPWTFTAASETEAVFTYIPNQSEFGGLNGGLDGDWLMVPTLTINGAPFQMRSWIARVEQP